MIELVKRNFADIRLTHPYFFLGTTTLSDLASSLFRPRRLTSL
jgi:hypothetical protein